MNAWSRLIFATLALVGVGVHAEPLDVIDQIRALPAPSVRMERVDAAALAAFDAALVFSTKYEPPYEFLPRLPFWDSLQQRYLDHHSDVEPAVATAILGGRLGRYFRLAYHAPARRNF